MSERTEKVSNFIKELAASYFGKENNKTSLITVTAANVSPDLKRGTVFITVLPESKEHEALEFTKRKRADLREYLKKNMQTKVVPFLDVEIDKGEKNRQKIDELLREK
jgi:ribosome-binding factor A